MTAPQLATYSNGVSQVSGDNLNTFAQTCNYVSDLRAFTGTLGMQVYMRGYTAIADGGQGWFYWNTTTGTDDNGVTTIVPNGSSAGCWTRLDLGTADLFSYVDVISNAKQMSANTGYIADSVVLVTLNLPATISQGKIVEVVGNGAGGWKITQNAGQIINFGNVSTSNGDSGYLSSTNRYDTVRLLCTEDNYIFSVLSSVGNITYN